MDVTPIRMNPPGLPDAGRLGYAQISVTNAQRLAFVSGQVAVRAEGTPTPDSLEAQAGIVFDNLAEALAALDAEPAQIVQMRIYVTDLCPEKMEVVMPQLSGFLNGVQPSVTGVGVSALASPELQLEIEMVVSLPA
ncbi:MAG: RidA family protein [Roseovarius sp.]